MMVEGEDQVMVAMPRYKCHKIVSALKIAKVETTTPPVLWFEEEGFGPKSVSMDYVHKHSPKAGGYYVVYEDGYESFSPAKAFEEGYTKL